MICYCYYYSCSFLFLFLSFFCTDQTQAVITTTTTASAPALPLGVVNVLVLTDVHSWIGGHGEKEPTLNVDYGDVLSFYRRLKQYCQDNNHDLWFVMNGDWIDGTGLALNGDPSSLIPLLEKMPWDAVNVGNHELYHNSVIQYITRPGGFVHWWGERYLSSNVVHSDTMEPLGNKYRILQGRNAFVLTFGFLYNMMNSAELVTVKQVETVVEESWFRKALQEDYDCILVLAHMDAEDSLIQVILSKIRSEVGNDMPVQFLTGHTHLRKYVSVDEASSSFEAGRYLDTLGFASFPSKHAWQSRDLNATNTSYFKHVYIDANVDEFRKILNSSFIDTEEGEALSTFIEDTQRELGLMEEIGCVSQSYYLIRNLEASDSLWKFFVDKVVPARFEEDAVVIMRKDGWRYDLLGERLRLDDVIAVTPFNETMQAWSDIPGEVILMLNRSINNDTSLSVSPDYLSMLPNYILAPASPSTDFQGNNYTLITNLFEASVIYDALVRIYPRAADIDVVDLIPTTSSIWIDFFKEDSPCGSSTDGSHPHFPNPFRSNSTTSSSQTEQSSLVSDNMLLIFVGIALASVGTLCIIHVMQRTESYRERMAARDKATLDALREYHDADEEESDHEEGEFL